MVCSADDRSVVRDKPQFELRREIEVLGPQESRDVVGNVVAPFDEEGLEPG